MKFLDKFLADLDYAAAICLVLGLLFFAFMDGLKSIVEFFAPLGVLFGGRALILGAPNQPLIADILFVLAATFFALARVEGFWQNYHNLPLFAWTKPAAKPVRKATSTGFTSESEASTEPLTAATDDEAWPESPAEKPISGWQTAWSFLTAKRTLDRPATTPVQTPLVSSEPSRSPEAGRADFTTAPAVESSPRVDDLPPTPEPAVFYHREAEPPHPRHVEIYVPQEEDAEMRPAPTISRRVEENSSQIPPEREEDLEASELLRAAQSQEVSQGRLYDSNFDFSATPDFKSGFLAPSVLPVADPDDLISDPAEVEALVAENLQRQQNERAIFDDQVQKPAAKNLTASKTPTLGDLPTIDDILNSESNEGPANSEIEDLWSEPKGQDEV